MESNNDSQAVSKSERKDGWERETIEKLAFAAITEQRRARRWGIFFKMLTFLYLVAIFAAIMFPKWKDDIGMGLDVKGHTAVIDVVGMIAEDKDANASRIIKGLRQAAKDNSTRGIILNVNSPGGSPVQSDYIFHEIRELKKEYPDLPIISVVGDICASGGYYVASAADKIYVNQASLIGSIGVLMNGFGFVDTLDKLGVERRLLTSGEHKGMLDPFLPVDEEEIQHMQKLLGQVHQQFIDAVKEGRGTRLKETDLIFSGMVWTGKEGVELGLADDFGSASYVAKHVIGAEKLVNFTPPERLLDKLAGRIGASFGKSLGVFGEKMLIQ
ncbi:signal peptide peptidase SppA [Methylotuvimicrobium alcaliphilum]|uniref:Peptidase S49 n=1 Tax=Methylotuvimicrobium alcaliphilum (strain DSM 19304 / NCIMB 14124 / VKM B-2133 / 20Z) TaxID=1091494 RepID=G4T337_META2|nr:signal peptide peptidase SppA [Methylotuvimicrobium alcaliphilum]CCE24779.1 Putative peptidase S49 [Methylotuvimicrobium alcaliphilum 20Z]